MDPQVDPNRRLGDRCIVESLGRGPVKAHALGTNMYARADAKEVPRPSPYDELIYTRVASTAQQSPALINPG
ncbi:hypothetical protein J2Z31_001266 [Sinorhizobium kostiense]|uniref:Uncharacterized protein n=1 Tax=Sinorhizobium kostiense TaxID=76747 RepID=A0ABS4QXB8_9HYPH|nr:hypothetical protein [Sinorhizobium kostiense]